MRYRAATSATILLSVALAFLLISIVSIPVTKSIALCTYGGYKFGVFGYCEESSGWCSAVGVGYSSAALDSPGFSLPSNARSAISKLLIVHVIAAGFTFIGIILTILAHFKSFANSLGFLLFALVWSLPTFLLTLLAFLVDIILFIPHLSWSGWCILVSTVFIAISGMIVCCMRRNTSSRRIMKQTIENERGEYEFQNFGYGGFGNNGLRDSLPAFAAPHSSDDLSSKELGDDKLPLTGRYGVVGYAAEPQEPETEMDEANDTMFSGYAPAHPASQLVTTPERGNNQAAYGPWASNVAPVAEEPQRIAEPPSHNPPYPLYNTAPQFNTASPLDKFVADSRRQQFSETTNGEFSGAGGAAADFTEEFPGEYHAEPANVSGRAVLVAQQPVIHYQDVRRPSGPRPPPVAQQSMYAVPQSVNVEADNVAEPVADESEPQGPELPDMDTNFVPVSPVTREDLPFSANAMQMRSTPPPEYPASSVSSQFTSVSQRGINVLALQSARPNAAKRLSNRDLIQNIHRSEDVAVAVPYRSGMGESSGLVKPPAPVEVSDVVLANNPDFSLGVSPKKRPGRRKMYY